MRHNNKILKKWCLTFGQLLLGFTFCFGLLAETQVVSSTDEYSSLQRLDIENISPVWKNRTRGPSSYIPSDDVAPLPFQQDILLNKLLVDDNAGVLKSIKSDFKKWEEVEEYARNWNLQSTGLYNTPGGDHKRKYLNKKMIKYLDKRLSGEVKRAEQGSALHRVGQFQKALKPNTEARISKRVKIRFKARVLEGKAIVRVENPWVKTSATTSLKGTTEVKMSRDIKALSLKTSVRYRVDQGNWVAVVDRPLTENLAARVSSSQKDENMAFSKDSDRRIEFLFNKSF